MAVSFFVLAARDVDPEVLSVGGFDDGLVKVRLGDEPVKPGVEDLLVGNGFEEQIPNPSTKAMCWVGSKPSLWWIVRAMDGNKD